MASYITYTDVTEHPETLERRAADHYVLVARDSELYDILSTTMPFLTWHDTEDGGKALLGSTWLRITSRSYILRGSMLRQDPGLYSVLPEASGAILLKHFEYGLPRKPLRNLGEWFELMDYSLRERLCNAEKADFVLDGDDIIWKRSCSERQTSSPSATRPHRTQ